MAAEAAVHKRNLETSILFMQQEHAATLKALHEEIHKLQKRCTDLTFQLTMHGISVDEEGDVDSRLKEVHDQLRESQSNESLLESQLSQRDQRLQELEQELRALKKRQLDDMREAARTISTLKAEAEAKSNNIAFLTTELHRLKVKQKMEVPGQANAMGAGVEPGGIVRRGPTQPSSQLGHLPAPPRDMLTNSARLRQRGQHMVSSASVRRAGGATLPSPSSSSSTATTPHTITGTSLEGADLMARTLRVTSATARSSGSESPDITPFVQQRGEALGVVEVKKPAPLPPIAGSSLGGPLGPKDTHRAERDVRQVLISKPAHRRGHHRSRARPSTPEVTTLAVDQVSDANWKRPSESHSSEYN